MRRRLSRSIVIVSAMTSIVVVLLIRSYFVEDRLSVRRGVFSLPAGEWLEYKRGLGISRGDFFFGWWDGTPLSYNGGPPSNIVHRYETANGKWFWVHQKSRGRLS